MNKQKIEEVASTAKKYFEEKLGKEFYDDIGQLKTATEEANYFAENYEEEEKDDLFFHLKNWICNYLTVSEFNDIKEDK